MNQNNEFHEEIDPKNLIFHRWFFPVSGFILYLLVFLTGYFLNISSLNVAGAVLFFVFLLIGNFRHVFDIKNDLTVWLALLIMILPVVSYFLHPEAVELSYLIKHVMVYSSYIVIISYGLPPIYTRHEKKYLMLILLTAIFISLISGRSFVREEEIRLSGVFADPNNLALIGLSFFFFIDEQKDSVRFKVLIYMIIFIILLVTATSGALLALLIGMLFKYRMLLMNKTSQILAALLLICLFIFSPKLMELQSVMRIYTQVTVAIDNIHLLTDTVDINFGELAAEHAVTSLSGIWRLFHWLKAILMYYASPIFVILFGNGVGSSMKLLGNVPHNEYVRVLFEQGISGFIFFIGFYGAIARKIDKRFIHVLIMIAVFSITQNVIENMVFMFLFMLYLATSQTTDTQHSANTTADARRLVHENR